MAAALNRPQHILKLTKEEKLAFLNSFDYVFSDIDGVIWTLESNVPGAAAAYEQLERSGKQISFVTNNSVRTVENCVKRFESIGLTVSPQNIWHPAQNVVDYLRSINFSGLIFVIATEMFKKVLRDAGFKLIDGPTKILEESYSALAEHIFDREPVRAVIIDVDFNLNSPKILRAHLYLRNPDCILIAGATDMFLPVRKDVSIIGPGAFTKILVDAIQQKPITLGKPGKELGKMLISSNQITQPRRAIMIGDMLEQDVAFGKQCGFQTMVVLSGGCKLNDLEAEQKPEHIPDFYADSVSDIDALVRDVYK